MSSAKPLRWSSRQPSGPGQYWVRYKAHEVGITRVFMARVYSRLRPAIQGPAGKAILCSDVPYEWAGPIPKPEEPQGGPIEAPK